VMPLPFSPKLRDAKVMPLPLALHRLMCNRAMARPSVLLLLHRFCLHTRMMADHLAMAGPVADHLIMTATYCRLTLMRASVACPTDHRMRGSTALRAMAGPVADLLTMTTHCRLTLMRATVACLTDHGQHGPIALLAMAGPVADHLMAMAGPVADHLMEIRKRIGQGRPKKRWRTKWVADL
jgi:hypothetical protein